MAEPEFSAYRVQIGTGLRSLTRAGEVRISDGRVQLLTSYGREIDSAPVQAVRAGRRWFATGDRASAEVNGTRYTLTMDDDSGDAASDTRRSPVARRFIEAVRKASGHTDA